MQFLNFQCSAYLDRTVLLVPGIYIVPQVQEVKSDNCPRFFTFHFISQDPCPPSVSLGSALQEAPPRATPELITQLLALASLSQTTNLPLPQELILNAEIPLDILSV